MKQHFVTSPTLGHFDILDNLQLFDDLVQISELYTAYKGDEDLELKIYLKEKIFSHFDSSKEEVSKWLPCTLEERYFNTDGPILLASEDHVQVVNVNNVAVSLIMTFWQEKVWWILRAGVGAWFP